MNDLERVLSNLARLLKGAEEPAPGSAAGLPPGARPAGGAPLPERAPRPPIPPDPRPTS